MAKTLKQPTVTNFISRMIKDGGISSSSNYHLEFAPGNASSKNSLSTWLKDKYAIDMKSGQDSTSVSKIVMLANEIQIPGVSLTSQDVRGVHKGITMKPAQAKVYNEMDMSFILDLESMPLRFFKGWQDYILGTSETRESHGKTRGLVTRFYNDYACDIKVTKLEKWDKNKGSVSTEEDSANQYEGHYAPWSVTLAKAYPYMVSSIPYSSASAQVVKLSVGCYYEHSYFEDPAIPPNSFQNRVRGI